MTLLSGTCRRTQARSRNSVSIESYFELSRILGPLKLLCFWLVGARFRVPCGDLGIASTIFILVKTFVGHHGNVSASQARL